MLTDLKRFTPRTVSIWLTRLVWLLAPVFTASFIGPVLELIDVDGVALAIEIYLWGLWFVGLVSVLIPSPLSLTASRILSAATLGAALTTATLTNSWQGPTWVTLGYCTLINVAYFAPTFGDHMVNGSAYGSERRMSLRSPAFALLGPLQFAWLIVFVALYLPAVLLVNRNYVFVATALVVASPLGWFAGRVLHQMSRRWIVFVPAGMVIHDSTMLTNSSLCKRSNIASLGPAVKQDQAPQEEMQDNPPQNTERLDLSGGSIGLALELNLKEPQEIFLKSDPITSNDQQRIVLTPSLPGAVLQEARIRAITIK